jgi:outer membrane protein W
VKIEVGNKWAVKSELGMWYDLTDRVGVHASVAYLVVRPEVKIRTELGTQSMAWKADRLVLEVGVVYGIF